jgi:hypothetical protein
MTSIDPIRKRAAQPAARDAAVRSVADWLCLAATPTFALMALLTILFGSDAMAMMCTGGMSQSPFGGMLPMYLLMSLFHLPPWIELAAGCGWLRR